MKRTTQISIMVEHRRVAFTLAGAVDQTSSPAGPAETATAETGLERVASPPVCPDCGAPWIAVTAVEGELPAYGAAAIGRALQRHGLHAHVSLAGQLSICSKSFEAIQETL
jgi:hypothetical protein